MGLWVEVRAEAPRGPGTLLQSEEVVLKVSHPVTGPGAPPSHDMPRELSLPHRVAVRPEQREPQMLPSAPWRRTGRMLRCNALPEEQLQHERLHAFLALAP